MDKLDLEDLKKLLDDDKPSGKFSKKIVILILVLNILFTLGVFYVFLKTASEPSGLIISWFGFTTVELWSLSKIKRAEIKDDSSYLDKFSDTE